MTPEQRARFDAGSLAQLSIFNASMVAHDCAITGITTNNNALLEIAEDIGRRLRHENGFGPVDPLEADNLYACIVAATEATMCVLPLNHPARCQPQKVESEPIPAATTQPQMQAAQAQASPTRPPHRRVGYPALAGLLVRRPRQHASAVIQ